MDAREVDVEDTASILLQPTVHALPSPSVSAKAVMTSAAALAASVFNENDCDLGTKDLVGQNQRTNGFSNRSWDALRTPVRIKVSSLPKRKNEPPNARPETAKPPLESAKPRTTCWLSPKQSSKPSSGTDPTAESDPTFQKRSETSGPTSNNYGGPSESSRKLSDSAISPGNSPSEPERNHPELVQIQLSHCGNFNVVAESYSVPLMDGSGACLPMSRKCSTHVYAHPSHAKGIVLLVPGYANNRHMFDVGGGRGKSGISFMEFLVSRGYDTFAVDLRGTAESKRMGCVGASGLVEHVEVDIPSAIRMVKSIGRCEKVYLIGHSMGGALSCAVAGVLPNDIAGIVHLAGFYNGGLPIIVDILDIYKGNCPEFIRKFVSTSSSIAFRSAYSVVAPAANSILSILGLKASPTQGTQRASSGVDQQQSVQQSYFASFIKHLARTPLPVRSTIDFLLSIRRYIPQQLEQLLVNSAYPAPWLPYSVEDPWGLLELTVESPSVGVTLSMIKIGVHTDIFNDWLVESSRSRAEVRDKTDMAGRNPDIGTEDDTSSNVREKESHQILMGILSSSAERKAQRRQKSHPDTSKPNAGYLVRKPSLRSIQRLKYHETSDSWKYWNELYPFLYRFEELEHLPLFFCYANADAILRPRDSLRGYARSKSRWRDIIRYVDLEDASKSSSTTQKPSSVAASSESSALMRTASASMFSPGNAGGSNNRSSIRSVKDWLEADSAIRRERLRIVAATAAAKAAAIGMVIRSGSSGNIRAPMQGNSKSRSRPLSGYGGLLLTKDGFADHDRDEYKHRSSQNEDLASRSAVDESELRSTSRPTEELRENISQPRSRAVSTDFGHQSLFGNDQTGGFTNEDTLRAPRASFTFDEDMEEDIVGNTNVENIRDTLPLQLEPSESASTLLEHNPEITGEYGPIDADLHYLKEPWRQLSLSAGEPSFEENLNNSDSSTNQNNVTSLTNLEDKERSPPSNEKKPRDGSPLVFVPQYSIPATMTYGHCDILGGKNAEEIWERIVAWLDATSAREKEWRFSRRYSAR